MFVSPQQVAAVCRLAEDISAGGAGTPLRELLDATGYRLLRPGLTVGVLTEYLTDHPEVVTQWSRYSDDKRTSGGWYFLESGTSWSVGRLGPHAARTDDHHYASPPEACANFILQELDFWVNLQTSR
jgi:hypothetical protein